MLEPPPPRERLIVALDVASAFDAARIIERVGDAAVFYKIGMELAYGGDGLALVRRLAAAGKRVFLDLKLHDIPNTVERATACLAASGAAFLTIHGYPQTMRAAVAGAKGSGLKLLAVTVLTSYDDADLVEAGYRFAVAATVRKRAEQARSLGVDGLVAGAEEAAEVRAAAGEAMILVTPGIRPEGAEAQDQKRVATPARAIRLGADYLVVGRPITAAPDPGGVAAALVAEIATACGAHVTGSAPS
jgi:orotidine-5'-phosphate decarboxylase